jgi:hypothetical protein
MFERFVIVFSDITETPPPPFSIEHARCNSKPCGGDPASTYGVHGTFSVAQCDAGQERSCEDFPDEVSVLDRFGKKKSI